MDKVLIDTDVILDFFFDRQPFSEYSAQVIGLCETNKIKGYLTPVIYSNVYYLLRLPALSMQTFSSDQTKLLWTVLLFPVSAIQM